MADARDQNDPVTDARRSLGARIQYLRLLADMTQPQLAEAAGFQTQTITKIETAAHKPRFATLVHIAQALNVDLVELFVFEEVPAHDTEKRRELRKLMQLVRECEPRVIRAVRNHARITLALLSDRER